MAQDTNRAGRTEARGKAGERRRSSSRERLQRHEGDGRCFAGSRQGQVHLVVLLERERRLVVPCEAVR